MSRRVIPAFVAAVTARCAALAAAAIPRRCDPETIGAYLRAENAEFSTLISPRITGSGSTPVIIVGRKVEYAGIVVDETSIPLEGVWVSLRVPVSLERRWREKTAWAEPPLWRSITNTRGEFRFERAGWSDGFWLLVDHTGFERTVVELPSMSDELLVVELEATGQSNEEIRGLVLNAVGERLPGAWVGLGETSTRGSQDGEFHIPADNLQADDRLLVLKEGYAPSTTPARLLEEWKSESHGEDRFQVVLDGEPAALQGVVRWSDGAPVSNAIVWIFEGTPLKVPRTGARKATVRGAAYIEQVLAGYGEGRDHDSSGPLRAAARLIQADCDEAGCFSLAPLLDRSYLVHALDPETCAVGTLDCAPDAGAAHITMRNPWESQVSGVAVNSAGRPLEDVTVVPVKVFELGSEESRVKVVGSASQQTKANGEFSFPRIDIRNTRLRFIRDNVAGGVDVSLENVPDLRAVEVLLQGTGKFQLVLDAKADDGVSFHVLDGEGELLELRYKLQGMGYSGFIMRLRQGRSEIVTVSDQARTLVIKDKQGDRREFPLTLQIGETTVLEL